MIPGAAAAAMIIRKSPDEERAENEKVLFAREKISEALQILETHLNEHVRINFYSNGKEREITENDDFLERVDRESKALAISNTSHILHRNYIVPFLEMSQYGDCTGIISIKDRDGNELYSNRQIAYLFK